MVGTRRPAPSSFLWFVFAWLFAGCEPGWPLDPADDGGPGPVDPEAWSEQPTPLFSPPSDPGWLELGPPGLILAVGGTAQAWGKVYDSAGSVLPDPSMTWTTASPEIVTVSSTGQIDAVGLGLGQVDGTDGAHGTKSLLVLVSETASSGPTGIAFVPPVAHVEVGASVDIAFTLYDASGNVVTAAPAVDFTADSDAFAMTSDGVLTGTLEGLGSITASRMGAPLDGLLFTRSYKPPSSGPTGSCNPMAPPAVTHCSNATYPRLFGSTGLSKELRVFVVRQPPNCNQLPTWQITEESPTRVEVQMDGKVVAIGAQTGLLTSVAPGSTQVRTYVRDPVTQQDILCGCPQAEFRVSVYSDVRGTWGAECGEDTGSLTFHSGFPHPDWVLSVHKGSPYEGSGMPTEGYGPSTGQGCFELANMPYQCAGPITSNLVIGATNHVCTESTPCPIGWGHCATEWHSGPHFLLGDGRVEGGGCRYSLGGSGECDIQPVTANYGTVWDLDATAVDYEGCTWRLSGPITLTVSHDPAQSPAFNGSANGLVTAALQSGPPTCGAAPNANTFGQWDGSVDCFGEGLNLLDPNHFVLPSCGSGSSVFVEMDYRVDGLKATGGTELSMLGEFQPPNSVMFLGQLPKN